MSRAPVNRKRSERGDGLTVALVVAVLALGLAFGMEALGVLAGLDRALSSLLEPLAGDGELSRVPPGVSWPLLGMVCLGMAFAMVESPGTWRRLVLWISSGVVIAATVPLAALAARWLAPGAPLVAWLWSGVCSLVYAHYNEPGAGEPWRAVPRPSAGGRATGE
jgi:hypothetical protein